MYIDYMRECQRCEETKELEEFSGKSTRCKACMREVSREYYKKHKKRLNTRKVKSRDKSKHAEYMRDWRAKKKKED